MTLSVHEALLGTLTDEDAQSTTRTTGITGTTGTIGTEDFYGRLREPGSDLTEEAVMAYTAQRVSPHRKMRQVAFVGGVPEPAAGRTARDHLRAIEVTR
ncbi:hypothetical protein ACWGI8_33590 [Streptomyces sp. NPDC054841]